MGWLSFAVKPAGPNLSTDTGCLKITEPEGDTGCRPFAIYTSSGPDIVLGHTPYPSMHLLCTSYAPREMGCLDLRKGACRMGRERELFRCDRRRIQCGGHDGPTTKTGT
jgi:hypothetical protein